MLSVNFLAIFVAAVAAFLIGFLFHGPLFGKLWTRLAKVQMTGNENVTAMIPKMIWNFLVNIVSAYVLSVIYIFASASSMNGGAIMTGILSGLLLWLGVIAATSIDVIWMGKSVKLWLFECVSSLVVFAVMGAIIASWK
jgi:hypothetical protein